MEALINAINKANPGTDFKSHFESNSFMMMNGFNDLWPMQAQFMVTEEAYLPTFRDFLMGPMVLDKLEFLP